MRQRVKKLLEKSRDSALLAVEIYNKPRTSFRSNGYIVLMCIAWTSLLHAIYEKAGRPYCYKNDDGTPKVIDGETKAWELGKCASEYYLAGNSPERKNIDFFVALRNKIEHRFAPELDDDIFGECQALLFNYESVVEKEFGSAFSINESLAFSLQFSRILHDKQNDLIRKRASQDYKELRKFVDKYRLGLTPEVLTNLNYNFRVFLVPKVANHEKNADFVTEFVKYDPTNPADVERYKGLIVAIKEKQVQLKGYTPKQVCRKVQEALVGHVPPGWAFNGSSHHARCWKYFNIRPKNGARNPAQTDPQFCYFDETFGQYAYTNAWVDKLILELKDATKRRAILGH